VELALARQAVRGDRRFALYVSATQQAANRHVQAVASTMERVGIERSVNKYGNSRGWTQQLLRTSNGFNVLSLGLDAAVRGIKLDEFRPDIIVLDDIDSLGDSIATVQDKVEVLAQSILIAGSSDVAVAFIQNAIHMHSMMSGVQTGALDLLRRRQMAPPVSAVNGLTWKKVVGANGNEQYVITGGTASWAGKSIAICEAEINETGLIPFLRECQHDTGVGGRFFADWAEARHVVFENEVDFAPFSRYVGGYDWGYNSPCCFLLARVDDQGRMVVIDEVYGRQMTNPEQAAEVVACIARWRVPLDRVAIYADPSMWAMKTDHAGRRVADVEAFHRAGLRFAKATNDRRGGWQNVRRYVREDAENLPLLRVVRGRCSNLIRTLPLQVYDKLDIEDLDTDGEDHAVDALRYMLSARPRAIGGVELGAVAYGAVVGVRQYAPQIGVEVGLTPGLDRVSGVAPWVRERGRRRL